MQAARNEFRQFNEDAVKAASSIKQIETQAKAGGSAVGGFFKQIVAGTVFANGLTGILQNVKQAIINFAKGSIEATSHLTELDSKARVVFGDTFPQVQKQVKSIAQEVGRASTAVLQFTADIGAIFDAVGLSKKNLGEMSTTIAKLAIDLASFVNSSDEEAFQALQSGLVGMVQPLRRFGVVLTEENLKQYLFTKGVKDNYDKLNEAQKVLVRYAFILDHTKTAQGDAARTAESFANESRRLQGEVQSLQEQIGKDATPVLAEGLGFLASAIQNTRVFVKLLISDIGSLFAVVGQHMAMDPMIQGLVVMANGVSNAVRFVMKPVSDRINADIAANNTTPFGPTEDPSMKALRLLHDAGGGSKGDAKKAIDELAKAKEKIAAAEKDILDAIEKQAKANIDYFKTQKDQLELKQKLGVLTKEETKELETINRRIAFKKDLIDDATKAWEDQVKAVDDVKKKIEDINQQIADERKNLKQTLADIDKDAGRDKVKQAADIIRQMNDIRAKADPGGGGLSSGDSYKIGELQTQLQGYDANTIQQATDLSKLNPSQTIDFEAAQKKKDAQEKSDARVAELQAELDAENKKLVAVQQAEEQKKQAVIKSLKDRESTTFASYKLIEDETQRHIDAMAAKYAELVSKAQALAGATQAVTGVERGAINGVQARAAGGMIYGAGGPTDDRIPALLSNGEFVVNAMATRANRGLLERINSQHIPRFANGGIVNNSHSSSTSVTVNAHGDAARGWDAGRLRWELRKGF